MLISMLATAACEDGGAGPELRETADASSIRADEGSPDAWIEFQDAVPVDAADADTVDAQREDAAPGDARVADGGVDAGGGGLVSDWPTRSCQVVIQYAGEANEVVLAGDFTDWQNGARPLRADVDGFSITLGPDDGLVPGQLHAYKLIVDGVWRIDPAATHHKYDGDCANSALLAPACTLRPEIRAEAVQATSDGSASTVVTLYAASDGVAVHAAELKLDGGALDFEVGEGGRIVVAADGLAAGRHVFGVRARDADGREALPVDLPFWVEEKPFDYRDGTLYLLLVDRFANGNRGIDDPVGDPVTYPADWHGGDLWGALQVLETGYFEQLGVNAIWLSPLNEQVDGHFGERGGGDQQIAAYHGYWPVSARDVEPRFGGNDALKAFVDAAHARGIRILLDLINNQVHEQHEYVAAHPEWFRTECVCGIDAGCGWSERPLDCLFARYLPDIDWRNAGAEAQFTADAVWWIETFGVDGFRVDAVKHVETSAVYNLRAELHRRFEQGGERVVMLGETAVGEGDVFDDGCGERYGSGYAWIEAYTGETALDGQFDFPTHHRTQWGVLTGTMGYDDVEAAIAQMEAQYTPEALHVRFLGSHDSSRMASRAAQHPARDCRFAGDAPCDMLPGVVDDPAVFERLRRAWALLLTIPGVPLLYYGDELAMAGAGDPDNRRDMLWSGALADVAMSVRLPSPAQQALRDWIGALGAARAAHPALTRGARRALVVEPDLYAYERTLDGDAAVVVLNRGAERVVELAGTLQIVAGDAALTDGGVRVPAGGAVILGRQP